ncbi:hypothetical protein Tco_1312172 [Tanacetum coccineum]
MAEGNVPALTKTDEQLVLINARLPIGKSNLLMDLQRKQKNPIFLILLDILQNTNFFRAFTASANLDEQWFTLDDDLLRSALGIAPKDPAQPFVAPLDADLVIDFVNNLGYPEELQFVYKMLVPSSFVIFDLEPLSLSFKFVFMSEIFKSFPSCPDHLCHLDLVS